MKKLKLNTILIILITPVFIFIFFVGNLFFDKLNKTQSKQKDEVDEIKKVTSAYTPTPLVPTINVQVTPFVPTKIPENSISAKITFYGWSDNSPPGNGIAYPKSRYPQTIHEVAGGSGTYTDPITFASSGKQFAVGSRIYLPYLKKYAIKEDLCPSCGETSGWHVDLWMESDDRHPSELHFCEGAFTREKDLILINPSPGLPVDTTPLFNPTNGTCFSH